MTTLLGVPVIARGEVLGDLYLTDREDGLPFSEEDERLAILLARHAAVAIQNARLHVRLQDVTLDEERHRIMRDLHDGIIQSLFAIGLMVQDTLHLVGLEPPAVRARLERTVLDLDAVMGDISRYILDLERGPHGQRRSLESRLERLVAEFQSATPMQLQLSVAPDAAEADLAEDALEHLVQIAREGLANAIRHSQADAAAIRVERTRGRLVLTIWDNGVGFSAGARRSSRQRGLRNMRERARNLGGAVRIVSQTGQGTRIFASVPLQRAAPVP
jgi:signal transduction histidine kinase